MVAGGAILDGSFISSGFARASSAAMRHRQSVIFGISRIASAPHLPTHSEQLLMAATQMVGTHKLKFYLARLDTTRHVQRVERVETSVSSLAVRHARRSQNAWARHVERVVSCRDVTSQVEFGLYCGDAESARNENARHENARH